MDWINFLDLGIHEKDYCTNERNQREKRITSRFYGLSLGDHLVFCKIMIKLLYFPHNIKQMEEKLKK